MEIGVVEAASRMGLSQQRVRQLLAAGRLNGRRIGGRWVVDEAAAARSRALPIRPMSPRMIWALLDEARRGQLRDAERARIRAKLSELANAEDPAGLLRSWGRHRAEHSGWRIHSSDIADLADDPRLIQSGISDPRAGLSAVSEIEGYLRRSDLAALVDGYLLVPERARPNVLLHAVDDDLALSPAVPLLVVAADLADHDQPRENAQAARLIREAVSA